MSLIFTKTDINVLLYEVFNNLNTLARDKQLQYDLLLPRISLMTFVDQDVLRKAVSNLTYNAVKYAEREVSVKLAPFNSDDHMFNIEIKNDGALIPTERRSRSHELAELQKGSLTLIPVDGGSNLLLLSIPILQDQGFTVHPVQARSFDGVVSEKDFMGRLKTIIYNNISDIELNVGELAKLMNMSRPTLYRKIKELSNSTPNELINISKLKKATELLAQKTYTITQVAAMVGYSVQSNFSRDFHKHYGMSPSIYMATIKGTVL
jgi:AraC-like DNA-binding protein